MQAAVETDENAPLRAFVVAVQEGFMLEHMEVNPNKALESHAIGEVDSSCRFLHTMFAALTSENSVEAQVQTHTQITQPIVLST